MREEHFAKKTPGWITLDYLMSKLPSPSCRSKITAPAEKRGGFSPWEALRRAKEEGRGGARAHS